jgi:hypothetical protein
MNVIPRHNKVKAFSIQVRRKGSRRLLSSAVSGAPRRRRPPTLLVMPFFLRFAEELQPETGRELGNPVTKEREAIPLCDL